MSAFQKERAEEFADLVAAAALGEVRHVFGIAGEAQLLRFSPTFREDMVASILEIAQEAYYQGQLDRGQQEWEKTQAQVGNMLSAMVSNAVDPEKRREAVVAAAAGVDLETIESAYGKG